jgi:hypothetical protein
MNMANKRGVFEEKAAVYWKADKKRRGEILDAVCEVSGLSRKRAIKRFAKLQRTPSFEEARRGRPVVYTPDVVAALKEVWEIGSEACGENMHPMIGEYVDIRLGEKGTERWQHSDEATGKLRRMSLGSVKRYVGKFVRTRRNFGGASTTQKSSVVSMVPIRMDGWDKVETGVTQVDTVAHCGAANAGDFAFTVNGTDVAVLWGSRRAQWNKGQEVTKISLARMREDSPFPWTEAHPDTGSEFINRQVIAYARESGLRMTRSRPYHKNDNCFVEERNGHIVRAYVGYERFDVHAAVNALNDLYDVLTPYLNHFIASRRIVSKERIGAKWKVTREKVAKTPYQRVLERNDVSAKVKNTLRLEHAKLNPRTMKTDVDRLIKRVHDIQRRYGHPRKLSKSS